jgi:hypothetical protein
LAKISEILAGADILSTPIFVTFSAWRAGINELIQCGRESAHKSGAASGNTTLGDYMREDNIFKEENISEVWEKPATAEFAGPKQ